MHDRAIAALALRGFQQLREQMVVDNISSATIFETCRAKVPAYSRSTT